MVLPTSCGVAFISFFLLSVQINCYTFRNMGLRNGFAGRCLQMVSVGPGSNPLPRPKAYIISPSTQSSEGELLDLNNFNSAIFSDKKKLGIIGSKDLTEGHRQMVELLSYALVLSGNHVFTSGGGSGTNIAVIRGALRACNPDMLTVILPQSLLRQPAEMQPLLSRVANLIEQPEFDDLDIKTAAEKCNDIIISQVEQVLMFIYHDSTTLLKSIENRDDNVEVTKFFLD